MKISLISNVISAFFVNENLRYTERSDISKSTIDFETLWIEIQSNMNYNLLCGVIYRHPQSDLDSHSTTQSMTHIQLQTTS